MAATMSRDELCGLGRRELQALAKANGVKANGKSVDIIAALSEIWAQQETPEDNLDCPEPPVSLDEEMSDVDVDGELDDVSAASQESIEPRQSQQEVAAFFINEELANGAFADADKAACQMIEEESPSPLPTPPVEVPDNSESVTLAMGEPQAATLPPSATSESVEEKALDDVMAMINARLEARGVSTTVKESLSKARPSAIPRFAVSVPRGGKQAAKFNKIHNRATAKMPSLKEQDRIDKERQAKKFGGKVPAVYNRLYQQRGKKVVKSTECSQKSARVPVGAGQVPQHKLQRTPKNTLIRSRPVVKSAAKKPKFDLQKSLAKGKLPWKNKATKTTISATRKPLGLAN